jgi:hypothetical protein
MNLNTDNSSTIIYSNGETQIIAENDKPEFQEFRDYCRKNNKTSLNQQELEHMNNKNFTPAAKPSSNTLLLACGIGGTFLIIGVILGLLIRKNPRPSVKK